MTTFKYFGYHISIQEGDELRGTQEWGATNCLLGGKAFATYTQANRIVKLVNDVGVVVNRGTS